MTNQPLNAASLRGAVDLSSLKKPASGGPQAVPRVSSPNDADPQAGSDDAAQMAETFRQDGLVVEVTAENFQALVQQSTQYPVIIAVWAGSQPASRRPIDVLARAVREQNGRVLLGVADLDAVPEIGQVFAQLSQQGQPGQILAAAFVQGQPIPIPPVVEDAAAQDVIQQVVDIAVQNGMAGRVPNYDPNAAGQPDGADSGQSELELPALHKVAYDAIDKGDYEGAIAAFEQALKEKPKDDAARIALGQVKLMQRTQGVELQTARDAAAADPSDVDAQLTVADLDVLGGHVEDAFTRLIDLVKVTQDDERTKVREHLVGLFNVVGAHDERVKKARRALTSALY